MIVRTLIWSGGRRRSTTGCNQLRLTQTCFGIIPSTACGKEAEQQIRLLVLYAMFQ